MMPRPARQVEGDEIAIESSESCEKRHQLESRVCRALGHLCMHDHACVGAIASFCRFQAGAATVRVRVTISICANPTPTRPDVLDRQGQHAVKGARISMCSSRAGCRSRAKNWGQATRHGHDSKWHLADRYQPCSSSLVFALAARRSSSLAAGHLALADRTHPEQTL